LLYRCLKQVLDAMKMKYVKLTTLKLNYFTGTTK
jgi:hypothetical protein